MKKETFDTSLTGFLQIETELKKIALRYAKVRSELFDRELDEEEYDIFRLLQLDLEHELNLGEGHSNAHSYIDTHFKNSYVFLLKIHYDLSDETCEYYIPWAAIENFDKWEAEFREERMTKRVKRALTERVKEAEEEVKEDEKINIRNYL